MHRLRLKDQAFEDKNALVARWFFFFCLGHVPTVPALFNGGTRTDPAPDPHPQHDEKAQ